LNTYISITSLRFVYVPNAVLQDFEHVIALDIL